MAAKVLDEPTKNLLAMGRIDIRDMRYARKALRPSEQTDTEDIMEENSRGDCKLANVAFASVLVSCGLLRRYMDHPTSLPEFSSEEVRRVVAKYWEMKSASVIKMIDVVVHSDKYRHPKDKKRSMRDYLYVRQTAQSQ